ncbi:protein snail-like [Rhagoletis pomonella]|uniref:protein snail-like n=1 Tax=Rhagoletis pomonella TaxID=28610 RepID=UPI0017841D44|nr:protein snail-like [Rhagoletis pomonella]
MATTHAAQDTTTKYKSCPLKKRPIKYEQAGEKETVLPAIAIAPLQYYAAAAAFQVATVTTIKQEPHLEHLQDEQPQDLSLKRKASVNFADYSVPAKREYVLNLSKCSYPDATLSIPTQHYRPDSPANSVNSLHNAEFALTSSSAMLSPAGDYDEAEYHQQQPANIHLRGLTAATSGYTTASTNYKSAFMLAAGATPMTALWSAYQPALSGGSLSSIFPSPASSIATSPRSAYSYQHMTPPSSPGSEAGSEPEDLSVHNDIPLPALYHHTELALSASSSSSGGSKSLKCHDSAASAHHSSSSNAAQKQANYRYKCDKCSKMYSTSIGLSKHQQFHCPAAVCNQDKKQHSCHECGKLYTTVGALKMHIRTHTLPCKCPICGKAFSRPWLLQGHIRTHTGEKPFHCSDCPRSFADRSNLRAHQQTHVEVKRYACKVCNKSFSRMSLLNKHASSNCTITIA